MQEMGVFIDTLSGALYSPSDTLAGTLANTLSPKIVYEIGQHFKQERAEGSPEHLLAQTLVAAATASIAGNDALSAGLSAGGAEALSPILSQWLYDTDPQSLTSEQKEVISNIVSLGSAAIGAAAGDTTDIISSSAAGTVATEDNGMSYWNLNDINRIDVLQNGSINQKIRALIEAGLTPEEIKKSLANDATFRALVSNGDEVFNDIYLQSKEEVDSLNQKIDNIVTAMEIASIAVVFVDGVSVKLTDMAAKKLIKEAIEQGIKISPDKIVSIAKVDGKIVWLEKGYQAGGKGSHKGAGLEHIIIEHGNDFLKKGISESQISQTIMKAVQENNVVGNSSIGTVYRTVANGKPIDIAIGIGDNGFIVRASPITKFKPIH
jgi:hypothetical protein